MLQRVRRLSFDSHEAPEERVEAAQARNGR
jgi:hypothetical protein